MLGEEVERDDDLTIAKELADLGAHIEDGRTGETEVSEEDLATLDGLFAGLLACGVAGAAGAENFFAVLDESEFGVFERDAGESFDPGIADLDRHEGGGRLYDGVADLGKPLEALAGRAGLGVRHTAGGQDGTVLIDISV